MNASYETLNISHSSTIVSLPVFSEVAQMLLKHLKQAFSHKRLRYNVVHSWTVIVRLDDTGC
jgi:hypothetical protein